MHNKSLGTYDKIPGFIVCLVFGGLIASMLYSSLWPLLGVIVSLVLAVPAIRALIAHFDSAANPKPLLTRRQRRHRRKPRKQNS